MENLSLSPSEAYAQNTRHLSFLQGLASAAKQPRLAEMAYLELLAHVGAPRKTDQGRMS